MLDGLGGAAAAGADRDLATRRTKVRRTVNGVRHTERDARAARGILGRADNRLRRIMAKATRAVASDCGIVVSNRRCTIRTIAGFVSNCSRNAAGVLATATAGVGCARNILNNFSGFILSLSAGLNKLRGITDGLAGDPLKR